MTAFDIDYYIKLVCFDFGDQIKMLTVTLEELDLFICGIVTLAESNLVLREINANAIDWG